MTSAPMHPRALLAHAPSARSLAKSECPLCGPTRVEKVSDSMRHALDAAHAGRAHRCQNCGLIFLHPMMSDEQMGRFYRDEFRRMYHGARYSVASFHRNARIEARRRRLQLAQQDLLGGSVLEIGSATGAFLESLLRPESGSGRQSTESVLGVEPDRRQQRFARKLGLPCVSDIDDVPSGCFDLIVMFHVLEHLREPVKMLARAAQRLKPGGALVIEVPNVDDALLSTYSIPEFEEFYWHPAHSLYFSRDTLTRAGVSAGLSVRVEPLQRYSLSNHLHWAVHRRPGGSAAFASHLSEQTQDAYAADLCRHFLCDTLWMVARRTHVDGANP